MTQSETDPSLNPLLRYSMAGQGNALEREIEHQEPLLGSLTLKGQVSIFYAPPNTGKTLITLALIIRAVSERRIRGEQVFYINADDSASGMAQKVKLLDDLGVNTLTPGFNGFTLAALAPAMATMTDNGTATGTLIVIDTVKKFTDLMSKRDAADFGKQARMFSLKGGSLLGLAHTNKNRSQAGKLIHAGTSDLVEDCDSVHMLEEVVQPAASTEKLIKATAMKRRGNNAEETYFKFIVEEGLSYEQRLLSVEETHPEYGDAEDIKDAQEDDLIDSIKAAITHGKCKKMEIALIVGKAVRASRKKTLEVLEKYTGPNPGEHLWDYERKERGAHVFFLHPPTSSETETD